MEQKILEKLCKEIRRTDTVSDPLDRRIYAQDVFLVYYKGEVCREAVKSVYYEAGDSHEQLPYGGGF